MSFPTYSTYRAAIRDCALTVGLYAAAIYPIIAAATSPIIWNPSLPIGNAIIATSMFGITTRFISNYVRMDDGRRRTWTQLTCGALISSAVGALGGFRTQQNPSDTGTRLEGVGLVLLGVIGGTVATFSKEIFSACMREREPQYEQVPTSDSSV